MSKQCSRLLAGLVLVLPMFAFAADGQPSFDRTTDTGLYVWRTAAGDWQARMLAAAGSRQVAGSFVSSVPVSTPRRIALEADDVLSVVGSGTVEFNLRTARYDVDGLAFSAPGGGLCLRTTSAVPIFLGRDEVPATSPVDLTNNGACSTGEPQASGLDIHRNSQFDWQVELSAQGAPTEFDGVFEFSEPLESYQVEQLEGADRVSQPASDRLNVFLRAWPGGGRDVVRLTTLEFTKICLRSARSTEQTIALSSVGQAEPFRVTTPVDLTNNGACGLPVDPFPPPTYGRKFNPGHYVLLTGIDDHETMAASAVPGVRGFMVSYDWRDLERRWGVYDFSAIEADLALATSLGTQFVAVIADKTFANKLAGPDYLRQWSLPNRAGGYTMARWEPYVRNRYGELIAAVGRRFDSHPNFEGIATSESAPSLSQDVLQAHGYTAEKYRDALIAMLTRASGSLPTSRVFWYMNFLPGGLYYMGEIARSVAPHGVVLGGPDVMPDEVSLQLHPYPFYDGAVGHMPTFSQVEPSCYHHPHADPSFPTRFWTPPELFEYARDELHVSYMFWARWRWRPFPDSYNWWDAIPVIESHPDFNLD